MKLFCSFQAELIRLCIKEGGTFQENKGLISLWLPEHRGRT